MTSPRLQPARNEQDAALESLLAVVMAWIGGDDEARPEPAPPGGLLEALSAALVALWEDRVAHLQPGSRAGLVIDRLPVGAGLLDPAGRLLRANSSLLQIIDQHGSTALGAPISELLQLGPSRWAAWTAEAEAIGQHRAAHLISRTDGPLRVELHLAPVPTGWAIARVEAEAAPVPAPPAPAAGGLSGSAAALLDAALAAGLPHPLLRTLLVEAQGVGASPGPFAGRALRLRDGGAGPEAVEELGWRLRLRGAELHHPTAPALGPADPPLIEVWALAAAGEPPAEAARSPHQRTIRRCATLGTPPELDHPRGPMTTLPRPAFDEPAIHGLGQAIAAEGAPPSSVGHLPVLDREATAYLTEVEQATGKTGLFQRLLTLFINDLARHEGAVQASVAAADWVALGRAAHGIKGSAATIGARRIEQVSRALEAACREDEVPAAEATALGGQLLHHCAEFRSTYS